jgi:HAD superfamily hydrolase (TIGR01490 family)
MQKAAFFDLDGTLLTANSGSLWMKRERRHGRLNTKQMLEGTFFLFAYRFHVLDMASVIERALQTIKGLEESTVRQWTQEWFSSEVVQHAAPGAPKVIDEHRRQGHRLILLTSSSPYASEMACAHFGLDEYCSMQYEVREGRFTGHALRPVCYGEGKIHYAEGLARQHGLDLQECYFYTDSFSDIPMLERVGYPQVVHPDLRLRRVAREKGWPIHDWR